MQVMHRSEIREPAVVLDGDRGVRQPVHTVYVPADRFTHDLNLDWGRQAGAALAEHGGTPAEFAAFIAAETERFGKIVKAVGAKASE